MPQYRVRPGQLLISSGLQYAPGQIVEMPRHVADDNANRALVEEVDDHGQPVASVPVDDLAGFKAHERVSMLRDRIVAAQAVVASLEDQVAHEEQALVDAATVITDRRGAEQPDRRRTDVTHE
jgi:hypothetical protein